MERLAKVLADRGVASRRKSELLISEGRVRVNGTLITKLGTKVDPEIDRIEVEGSLVEPVRKVYIVLNKPSGYLSTVQDDRGRPTILDLVQVPQRIYPIGRLDLTSEGLLLLTNDGELGQMLLHPRFEHEREYFVLVEGYPTRSTIQRLRDGIELEDGRTWPARVSRLAPSETRTVESWQKRLLATGEVTWLSFVIHEGRKRQIRRMCETVGHLVIRLVRVRMGPIKIGSLAPGQWRYLTDGEVTSLVSAVH